MRHKIAIDDRHEFVGIRLARRMSHREHVAAREELLEVCRERKIRKILIDARDLGGEAPSTLELFEFGASWAKLGRDMPALIVAGVLSRDPALRKWWEFGETVAVNRGFATRTFEDLEQARAWLRDA